MVRTLSIWHIPAVEFRADVFTFGNTIAPPLLSKGSYVYSDPVTVSTFGASGPHVSHALAQYSIIIVSPATDSVSSLAFEFPPISPSEFSHVPVLDPRAREIAGELTVKEKETFFGLISDRTSIFVYRNISLIAIGVNGCLTKK